MRSLDLAFVCNLALIKTVWCFHIAVFLYLRIGARMKMYSYVNFPAVQLDIGLSNPRIKLWNSSFWNSVAITIQIRTVPRDYNLKYKRISSHQNSQVEKKSNWVQSSKSQKPLCFAILSYFCECSCPFFELSSLLWCFK